MKKAIERSRHGATKARPVATAPMGIDENTLLRDLRTLVQSARQRIATVAYSTQTLLCWQMGRRLSHEHLQGGRAAYGRQILVTVSRELTTEYGSGFSHTEITRMIRFAQLFPDEAIVVTLSQQLSWSHFHALLPIKDPLARDFYAEMCRIERWDVRTLRQKIGGMLFPRTVLNAPRLSTALREMQSQRTEGHRDRPPSNGGRNMSHLPEKSRLLIYQPEDDELGAQLEGAPV